MMRSEWHKIILVNAPVKLLTRLVALVLVTEATDTRDIYNPVQGFLGKKLVRDTKGYDARS